MKRRAGGLGLGIALLLLAPPAVAVDLLPTEVRFGDDEARILVRSTGGVVRVSAEPAAWAAGVAPGAASPPLRATPVELNATHVWRGIEGIVEIVLRRDDPARAVDVFVEDGANVGVWVEWPAASRKIPFATPWGALVVIALLRRAAIPEERQGFSRSATLGERWVRWMSRRSESCKTTSAANPRSCATSSTPSSARRRAS